ncbi:winged helix DNA-binding domain-containing protein [Rhodococcus sp. G-MC3]|uniref:winged helix DNA-binding domain-containing protein n=1 Tax=Rhodococcus sp. G-MC3 TaxID=3046209 RepID=UPI0024BADC94|nr:winged helix DNA-binding domain-containing protein [Rhodococcus sp. G-MC3]MDJ0392358.1 winged helix DNA-binding domain-containing protein [Rhodococcus sp. G-MC3]
MQQHGLSPLMSNRAVCVATLARQHLIERAEFPAEDMVSHLVGMQAQAPFPPYFGLWSRIEKFRPESLSALLEHRNLVRIVLMRGTVHLVTAEDAAFLRPLVQPIMDRDLTQNPLHGRALADVDAAAVAARARQILSEGPLAPADLGPVLAEAFDGVPPASLVHAARNLLPLVQVPPRAVWGKSGHVRLCTLEQWTGLALERNPSHSMMVLRYLTAFGPASVADVQAWSGLTRLGEVMDRLRPQLVTFTSEAGALLFDLPDAPRPDADTRLPVRIVAAFDNLLLSHADRSRVISAEARAKLFTPNGVFPPVVLVDGQVVGQVKQQVNKDVSTVVVTPYRKLSKAHLAAVAAEGRRMSKFANPTAAVHDVTFTEAV